MHAWTWIREYIADTALSGLKAQTGAGVIHKSKVRPKTEFPSIAVYNTTERATVENPGYINTTSDKRYRRLLDVAVEVIVNTNTNPDTALDALCLLVEQAIAADDALGDRVIATDLTGVTFSRDGEGETELHSARLLYRVEFRTESLDPETFLK